MELILRNYQNDALVLQYMAAAASVGIQMAVGASIGGA